MKGIGYMFRYCLGFWLLLLFTIGLWFLMPHYMSVGYIAVHSYAFFASVWGISQWKTVEKYAFKLHIFTILSPYAVWSYVLFWINEGIMQ